MAVEKNATTTMYISVDTAIETLVDVLNSEVAWNIAALDKRDIWCEFIDQIKAKAAESEESNV